VRAKAEDKLEETEDEEEGRMVSIEERLERLEAIVDKLVTAVEELMNSSVDEVEVVPFEIEEINGKKIPRREIESVIEEWQRDGIIR
jgi:uncharacterized protein YaaR (DUF327 family)